MQREREILEAERGGSFVLRFVIVSGILVVTAAFGALVGGGGTSTTTGPSKPAGRSVQSKGQAGRNREI
jgi:hypothetical protein